MFASPFLPMQPLRRLSLSIALLLSLSNASWAETDSAVAVQPLASSKALAATQLPVPAVDQLQPEQQPMPADERYWVQVELIVFTQPQANLMAEYWNEQLRPQYASQARWLMPPEGFDRPHPPTTDDDALAAESPIAKATDPSAMTATTSADVRSDTLETQPLQADLVEPAPADPQPGSLAFLPARPLPPVPEQDYNDGAFTLFSQEQRQQLLEAEPPLDRQDKPIHLVDLERLERQGHRILFQGIWNQPVAEPEQSLPILIRGGEALDLDHFELEGEIQLSLSRFLHLHPNLYYTAELSDQWQVRDPHLLEAQALAASAANDSKANPSLIQTAIASSLATSSAALSFGDGLSHQDTEIRSANQPPEIDLNTAEPLSSEPLVQQQSRRFLTVKLDQPRRIRRDELHYLDHPLFGLLIRMVPIDAPVIAADELMVPLASQAEPSISLTTSAAEASVQ